MHLLAVERRVHFRHFLGLELGVRLGAVALPEVRRAAEVEAEPGEAVARRLARLDLLERAEELLLGPPLPARRYCISTRAARSCSSVGGRWSAVAGTDADGWISICR